MHTVAYMMSKPLVVALLLALSACDSDVPHTKEDVAAAANESQRNDQTSRAPATDGKTNLESTAGSEPSGIILQYHHVDENTPDVTSISPDRFEEHLRYLEDNDFVIWPLDRLISAVRDGEPVPDKTVTITFDDAYLNIYENGFPLLRERDWPFTMFVATGLIGSNDRVYMTWEQLAEIQTAGALIANHTKSHTHLLRKQKGESDAEWKDRIRSEIVTAGDAIEENLGTSTNLFAYPYGEYNSEVLEIVEELGYVGLGQQSGPMGKNSNFLVLPRFPMSGAYSDLDSVRTKLLTLPLPVANSDVDPLLPLSQTRPSLTLHFIRDGLRFNQLVCYGPSETTELTQTDDLEFVARAKNPVPVGRSRYNCTMPAASPGRFYWFSQLWIRRKPDGSWYPEP